MRLLQQEIRIAGILALKEKDGPLGRPKCSEAGFGIEPTYATLQGSRITILPPGHITPPKGGVIRFYP